MTTLSLQWCQNLFKGDSVCMDSVDSTACWDLVDMDNHSRENSVVDARRSLAAVDIRQQEALVETLVLESRLAPELVHRSPAVAGRLHPDAYKRDQN